MKKKRSFWQKFNYAHQFFHLVPPLPFLQLQQQIFVLVGYKLCQVLFFYPNYGQEYIEVLECLIGLKKNQLIIDNKLDHILYRVIQVKKLFFNFPIYIKKSIYICDFIKKMDFWLIPNILRNGNLIWVTLYCAI